jgi:hypothetical protein
MILPGCAKTESFKPAFQAVTWAQGIYDKKGGG